MKRCFAAGLMGLVSVTGCGGISLAPDEAGELAEAEQALDDPAFVPIHVLPKTLVTNAPDLVVNSNLTVNTTLLTLNGATNPYFVRQGTYAVLLTGAFTVNSPIAVVGASPLIVVADDAITLSARINAGASGMTAGPGASTTGRGGDGSRFVPVLDPYLSGGGGGGYGTPGGKGGGMEPVYCPPGAAGATYGASIADPLEGGSSGGNGAYYGSTLGRGGGGGGAVQLSSAVSITLTATGQIAAAGGGGRGGETQAVGAGGGGSGGAIVLEAPAIAIAGQLHAPGGGGGGGGSGAPGSPYPATHGQDGTGATPAAGGLGGSPQGSNGGNGAAGVAGSFSQAGNGATNASKGGGGGGGAGRIWIRHPAAAPPVLTGAQISPPAAFDSTLP